MHGKLLTVLLKSLGQPIFLLGQHQRAKKFFNTEIMTVGAKISSLSEQLEKTSRSLIGDIYKCLFQQKNLLVL